MDKLGIQPTQLFAQVVNFAIIVVLLQKLLYKPILDMIAKRKKEIAEGLAITERMRLEEEKLKTQQEKAMAKAREQAAVYIEDAKKQAKDVEKELVDKAHAEAEAILSRAHAEAEEVKKSARASLQKEAVSLATEMTKRLLSSIVGAKEQHAYLAKRMKDLESWSKTL